MVSLFTHLVSFICEKIFTKQYDKWTDKTVEKEENENFYNDKVVASRSVGRAGTIWFIIFLIISILAFIIWADGMNDNDMLACGILFLVIACGGLYFTLMKRNFQLKYTETFIEKNSIFGKKTVYRWDELRSVHQKGNRYHLLFNNGKLKISNSKEYIGSERLIDIIQKTYLQ